MKIWQQLDPMLANDTSLSLCLFIYLFFIYLFIYLFIYSFIYLFIYLFWKCNFQNMLLQYYYLDDFSVWLTNVSLWLQFMQRCGLTYRWFSFLPCFGNFRDLIPLCRCKLILFYHTVLTYFLLMSRKGSD